MTGSGAVISSHFSQPKVSFVICTRNDDYAPSMAERQKKAFDVLFGQLDQQGVNSEIIIVDWNPMPDRPSMNELLAPPSQSQSISIRYISVPPEIHNQFQAADLTPMHAAAGWNVGIRRASGEFILPKSADTFYSDEIIRFLAQGILDRGEVYRCDRVDTPQNVLLQSMNPQSEDMLETYKRYCRPDQSAHPKIPNLHTNACGDFLLMHKEVWFQMGGFMESDSVLPPDVDGLALNAAVALGCREKILETPCVVMKPDHPSLHTRKIRHRYEIAWMFRHLMLLLSGVSEDKRLQSRMDKDYPRRLHQPTGYVMPSYAQNFIARILPWFTEGATPLLNPENWGCSHIDLQDITVCRASQTEKIGTIRP